MTIEITVVELVGGRHDGDRIDPRPLALGTEVGNSIFMPYSRETYRITRYEKATAIAELDAPIVDDGEGAE